MEIFNEQKVDRYYGRKKVRLEQRERERQRQREKG